MEDELPERQLLNDDIDNDAGGIARQRELLQLFAAMR